MVQNTNYTCDNRDCEYWDIPHTHPPTPVIEDFKTESDEGCFTTTIMIRTPGKGVKAIDQTFDAPFMRRALAGDPLSVRALKESMFQMVEKVTK